MSDLLRVTHDVKHDGTYVACCRYRVGENFWVSAEQLRFLSSKHRSDEMLGAQDHLARGVSNAKLEEPPQAVLGTLGTRICAETQAIWALNEYALTIADKLYGSAPVAKAKEDALYGDGALSAIHKEIDGLKKARQTLEDTLQRLQFLV